MFFAVVIRENLDCNYICSKIAKLLNDTSNMKDRIMVINIKSINDSDQCLLPKLEYKRESNE